MLEGGCVYMYTVSHNKWAGVCECGRLPACFSLSLSLATWIYTGQEAAIVGPKRATARGQRPRRIHTQLRNVRFCTRAGASASSRLLNSSFLLRLYYYHYYTPLVYRREREGELGAARIYLYTSNTRVLRAEVLYAQVVAHKLRMAVPERAPRRSTTIPPLYYYNHHYRVAGSMYVAQRRRRRRRLSKARGRGGEGGGKSYALQHRSRLPHRAIPAIARERLLLVREQWELGRACRNTWIFSRSLELAS